MSLKTSIYIYIYVCVCVYTQRELYDLEDKYKKAMMTNAHLDNEKQTLRYEADLLRDDVDDLKEHNTELQRELRDKTRVRVGHVVTFTSCANCHKTYSK